MIQTNNDHFLHIAGVNFESTVDGPGVRAAIYLSGCPHHCPGCHNPDTHDPEYGRLATAEEALRIAKEIVKRPYLQGITVTGGDPFYANHAALFLQSVLAVVGNMAPQKKLDIWVYTGYLFRDIMDHPLLQLADVCVDGPFIAALADKRLVFRGSANQRIIDVKQSLNKGEIILYEFDR